MKSIHFYPDEGIYGVFILWGGVYYSTVGYFTPHSRGSTIEMLKLRLLQTNSRLSLQANFHPTTNSSRGLVVGVAVTLSNLLLTASDGTADKHLHHPRT